MGRHPRGASRLDQGLQAGAPVAESAEPVRDQPICSGSERVREHVLVVEAVLGLPDRSGVGDPAEAMADEERASGDPAATRLAHGGARTNLGEPAGWPCRLSGRRSRAARGRARPCDGGTVALQRSGMKHCAMKTLGLFGPEPCGRLGLVFDRARKGWLCRDHTGERLCEFCQGEPARTRLWYHQNAAACEVWLCRDCAGIRPKDAHKCRGGH